MRAPVIIAPIILVATNSIAKSITDNKIAPKIPVSRVVKIGHIQEILTSALLTTDVEISVIAR